LLPKTNNSLNYIFGHYRVLSRKAHIVTLLSLYNIAILFQCRFHLMRPCTTYKKQSGVIFPVIEWTY